MQVLEQFLHHPIDTKEELLEAYLVGVRLQKFLSLVLPKHQDYFSNDKKLLRERSQEKLVELMEYLEPMARMIDEQEHEAFISRVIMEDDPNNTTEEESKVQHTIFSLDTNSLLASEDSGSSELPVVPEKNAVVFGESKESSSVDRKWEEPLPLPRGRRRRQMLSSKRDDRVTDPYQKDKLDDDPGVSRHEQSRWDSQDSIYPQQARQRRGSSDSNSSESQTIQWHGKDPTLSIPQQSRRRLGSKESHDRASATVSVQWDDEPSKQSSSKHRSRQSRRESRDHHVIDPYEGQRTQWEEEKSGRSTPSSSSSSGRRGSSKSSTNNHRSIDQNDENHWYEAPSESAASAPRIAQPASASDDSSDNRGSANSGNRSRWNDESAASRSSQHRRKASDWSDVRSSIDPNSTDEIQWDEESASYILKQPRSRQRDERRDSRGCNSPIESYETSQIGWDEESTTSPPAKQSSSGYSERPPLRPPSQVRRFEQQDRQWDDVLSLDPSSKKKTSFKSGRRDKKDESRYAAVSEWSSQSREVSSQWTKTNTSVASGRFERSQRSAGKKSSKQLSAVAEGFDPWTTAIYSHGEEEKESTSMIQPLESKIEKRLSRLEQKLEKRQAKTSNDKFFDSLDGESPISVHEFQDWMSSPSSERYGRARDGRIRLRDDDSLRLVDEEEEESVGGRRRGRLQPFRNCVKCLLE